MALNGHSAEDRLAYQLMERMAGVVPITNEEDFFVREDTLRRFLKARNWSVDESEVLLKKAVEWRREHDVINVECKWCHNKPGFHSIRQVGFDTQGRPVIYACFTQITSNTPTVDDTVAHCTYLIENAQKTMSDGVTTWVFLLDCRGMTLPACNPKIGYGLTQIFANFYPERLGQVVCLHHNPVFHGVWNAIKVFLHQNTVAKVRLIKSKRKISEEFKKLFDTELHEWLLEEMKLNKEKPISPGQKAFWKSPEAPATHDPRGCPSYIRNYVIPFLKNCSKSPLNTHKPHPNIVDELKGECKGVGDEDGGRKGEDDEIRGAGNSSIEEDSESEETISKFDAIDISEEYRIPVDSAPL